MYMKFPPDAILWTKPLTQKQIKRLQEEWKKRFGEAKQNLFQPFKMLGKMKYSKIMDERGFTA